MRQSKHTVGCEWIHHSRSCMHAPPMFNTTSLVRDPYQIRTCRGRSRSLLWRVVNQQVHREMQP